jgi:hypothetical protein
MYTFITNAVSILMIERAVANIKYDSEKLLKFKNISIYNNNNENKITPRRLVK